MKGTKMRINEIFYSIQGEGAMTGTPAIFVRFSGCNLKCPFCDTKHEEYKEMTESEIIDEINKYPAQWVVLTGGEPTLQVTDEFVMRIHEECRKAVAMETNGTRRKGTRHLDWLTCSPKHIFLKTKAALPALDYADEVKVVYDGTNAIDLNGMQAPRLYIQPCDTGDAAKNEQIINECINYIKQHPQWRLSLQTQKILKVR